MSNVMMTIDKRIIQKMCDLETRIHPVAEMTKQYHQTMSQTSITEEERIEQMYHKAVSIFQSMKSKRGKCFEEVIETELLDQGFSFLRQAAIDHNGTIIRTAKNKKGMRKPDIVLNASVGESLTDKTIISIKYSLRERKYEDTSIAHLCKKLYLVTMNVKNEEKEYEELLKHKIHLVVIDGVHNFQKCIEEIQTDV